MENLFPGYYRRSEEDLEKIWEDGLFVLDANVLLNLYRYSAGTRDELLGVLRKVQDRLWIPYQVADEFLRDRQDVITAQKDAYSAVRRSLSSAQAAIVNSMGQMHRDPGIVEAKDLRKRVDESFKALIAEAEKLEAEAPIRSIAETNVPEEDEIWQAVMEVFEGRVGEGLSPERMDEVLQVGPRRYESKVPPGYKDANDKSKPGDRRFGDLILWFEILDKAKDSGKPVLFVTDDRKEDWWSESGKTSIPRPELGNEMHREAGVLFHMYKPLPFLAWAGSKLNQKISDGAAEEIQELRPLEESKVDYGELGRKLVQWLSLYSPTPTDETPFERAALGGEDPFRKAAEDYDRFKLAVRRDDVLRSWAQDEGGGPFMNRDLDDYYRLPALAVLLEPLIRRWFETNLQRSDSKEYNDNRPEDTQDGEPDEKSAEVTEDDD